jgi:outer membrane receptor protein involved in Fe transport
MDSMRALRPAPSLALALVLSASPIALTTARAQALDAVIVTAQKREQSLQDAPIAITALDAQRLAGAGVRDIKDLALVTPGLLVASTSNPTYTTARVRGVGTVGDNPGLESSVGVVVDGVYRPRNGVALTDLGELDRVEVLKGPQGTLFGKNTSAGVINIVTARPSFDFGWRAEATYGEYDTRAVSAAVTGPISSTVAGRLYGTLRKRDGFYSVSTGAGPRSERRDDDQDLAALRGQLLIAPNDRAEVRLIADWSRRDENCCTGVQIAVGPTAAYLARLAPDGGVAQRPDAWARRTFSNDGTEAHIRDKGLSAEANLKLGAARLTSVTAWRQWTAALGQDYDFTSVDVASRPDDGSFSNRFTSFSQELRLAGSTQSFKGMALDWLVGGFYAREQLARRDRLVYGADYERYLGLVLSAGADPLRVSAQTGLPVGASFRPGEGLSDRYSQDEETAALFTNETLRLGQRFELTLGGRYTHEAKSVAALYGNSDNGAGCAAAIQRNAPSLATICLPWANPAFNGLAQSQRLKDDALTGTAAGLYRLSGGVNLYASYAHGWKASGFNLDRSQTGLTPDASTAFPAETVDNYETGLKTVWFGRRLTLNAALFHARYSDFQLNSFLGTTFTVRSVPRVTSKGLDLDFAASPLAGLSLQGGVVYSQTEYGDNAVAGLPRLQGARMSFAPLWSATLGAAYQRSVGPLLARVSFDAKYSSAYNTGSDLDPLKIQRPYTLANARLGIGAPDGRWTVEAFAQNLFDTPYRQVAFGAPFQTGTVGAFLGAPRVAGVTLRLKG